MSHPSEAREPARPPRSLKAELPRIAPVEPELAIQTFRLTKGIRLELVASEPLVVDPIDLAFDENGRMFVIEMIDYPFGREENYPPQGRVRLLEDTDQDGRVDRSFVFADKLAWPTAIALWDGGVFVAVAPEILYLKDTDGDNRADVQEVVFRGFGKSNVQSLINNIKWGLDNWFYAAGGGNGGTIRSLRKPDAPPVALGRHDFRFGPTGEFELVSGGGQFGHSFDDYGRRFVCNNSVQARHVVLEHRYLARNPLLPVPGVLHLIAADGASGPVFRVSPSEPWRVVRTRMRVAGQVPGPIEHGGKVTGYFTSATGITVYRGTALGQESYGNLFIGDVAGNLVHRKRLTQDRVTFRAERVEQNSEFLASTDIWFRPVNFANGPDGALYICDMYREAIEHPHSIPEIIKQHLDLTSGKDRGRIWRVTRNKERSYERPQLGIASTEELVAALRRRDAWWRETASRLLYERQDRSAIGPLEQLTRADRPELRVAALWALEGLGGLPTELIQQALEDRSPDVREQAVRLAETRLPDTDGLLDRLVQMASDGSSRVRLQLAYTLGEADEPRAVEGLAALARRDGEDQWIRTAILSSASPKSPGSGKPSRALSLFRTLIADGTRKHRVSDSIMSELLRTIGVGNNPQEVLEVLNSVAVMAELGTETRPWNLLASLGDGLRRKGMGLEQVLEQAAVKRGDTLDRMRAVFGRAAQVAADSGAAEGRRIAAVRLLAYGPSQLSDRSVSPLLSVRQAQPVQLAAVRALALRSEPLVADRLLEPWPSYSPSVRREVLEAIFSRPERLTKLLDQLEEGRVRTGDLGMDRVSQLIDHKNAAVRGRAERLLARAISPDRQAVVATYRGALAQHGDLARGKLLFQKHCITCHKAGREGYQVGPDLATFQERAPEALLEQILDPNREINPAYLNYTLATTDGRVLTGMIAAESATSVTLKRAEGVTDTVLRSNVEQLVSTGLSLMPEGLEKEILTDQMADLLAYIRQTGRQDQ